MAIDSEEKRRTTLRVLPKPDNASSEADRRRSIFIYGFEEGGGLVGVTLTVGNTLESLYTTGLFNAYSAESLVSLNSNTVYNAESSQAVGLYHSIGLEGQTSASLLFNIVEEFLVSVGANSIAPISNGIGMSTSYYLGMEGLSAVYGNVIHNEETVGGLSRSTTASVEALFALSASVRLGIDSLVRTYNGYVKAVESLVSIVAQHHYHTDSLGLVFSNPSITAESLVALSKAQSNPIEGLRTVGNSQVTTIDGLLGSSQSYGSAQESLVSVSANTMIGGGSIVSAANAHGFSVSNLQNISIPYTFTVEALETTIQAVFRDVSLVIESVRGVSSNSINVVDTLVRVMGNRTFNEDTLGATSTNHSASIEASKKTVISQHNDIGFLSALGGNAAFTTESLVRLASSKTIQVEGLGSVVLLSGAPSEALIGNSVQYANTVEAVRGIAANSDLSVETSNTIVFVSVNSNCPIESLIGVLLDSNVSSETDLSNEFVEPNTVLVIIGDDTTFIVSQKDNTYSAGVNSKVYTINSERLIQQTNVETTVFKAQGE